MTDSGNTSQVRVIADQVADAAITRFAAEHPEIRKDSGFSNFQKGVVGIATTLLVAAILWLVSTVNQMQLTLARLDERIAGGSVRDSRVDDLDRRVSALESDHKGDGK